MAFVDFTDDEDFIITSMMIFNKSLILADHKNFAALVFWIFYVVANKIWALASNRFLERSIFPLRLTMQ